MKTNQIKSTIIVGIMACTAIASTGCVAEGDSVVIPGQIVHPETGNPVDLNDIRSISVCYTVNGIQGAYDCRSFDPSAVGPVTNAALTVEVTDAAQGTFVATVALDPSDNPADQPKTATLDVAAWLKKSLYPDTFTFEYLTQTLNYDCPVPFWHEASNAGNLVETQEPGVYKLDQTLLFAIDPFSPESMYRNAPEFHGARHGGKCDVRPQDI